MKGRKTLGTVTHTHTHGCLIDEKRAGKNSALLSIEINRLLNSEIKNAI